MLEAIKIGIAEVNAAGGAAGRELKLYAEDDQTRPDAAVLAARKLVDIQHVDAMIGIWSSAVQLATLPITNAAGILSFNTCGAPEIRTEDKRDLVFQFYASNAIIGAAFAAIGQRLGYKRAAVLGYNNATMSAQANHFKAAWEKRATRSSARRSTSPTRPLTAPRSRRPSRPSPTSSSSARTRRTRPSCSRSGTRPATNASSSCPAIRPRRR